MADGTVSLYQTDFGAVRLGPAAEKLPRRKNGDFDMRFAAARSFVSGLRAQAEKVYMSHRRKTLSYYNG